MDAVITKWGNSQGIRIPKNLLAEAGMQVEETVDLEVTSQGILIRPSFRHKTLEERAAAYAGKLNLLGELDYREQKLGREIW